MTSRVVRMKSSSWVHVFVRICLVPFPVMITRPAGHNAEARKSEDEAEAQHFFEAEATVYEAEARYVREQLSVYEHED